MAINVDGDTYYRTAEACRFAGISKNTLLRWIKEGDFPEAQYKDRRGWRLFSQGEVDRLKKEVNSVQR